MRMTTKILGIGLVGLIWGCGTATTEMDSQQRESSDPVAEHDTTGDAAQDTVQATLALEKAGECADEGINAARQCMGSVDVAGLEDLGRRCAEDLQGCFSNNGLDIRGCQSIAEACAAEFRAELEAIDLEAAMNDAIACFDDFQPVFATCTAEFAGQLPGNIGACIQDGQACFSQCADRLAQCDLGGIVSTDINCANADFTAVADCIAGAIQSGNYQGVGQCVANLAAACGIDPQDAGLVCLGDVAQCAEPCIGGLTACLN